MRTGVKAMKKKPTRYAHSRSELDRIRSYAGLKVPEIARYSGIPYGTLSDHLRHMERMTVDDLLAWMSVCGCEELTIRR